MLKKEHNDLLTQSGPRTPMGQMFRSYWIPSLLAEELFGEGLPAGESEACFGAHVGVPRYARPLRPDRRVLRAPRYLALVQPQRGRNIDLAHNIPARRIRLGLF